MSPMSVLVEAIRLKKPIMYTYNKPGKTPGRRVGNPYAIYNARLNDGSQNVNVHIVQTEGVSESTDRQPLPSFRTHTLEWLGQVEILHERPSFSPDHPDYNPGSSMYSDAIAQV